MIINRAHKKITIILTGFNSAAPELILFNLAKPLKKGLSKLIFEYKQIITGINKKDHLNSFLKGEPIKTNENKRRLDE